MSKSTRVVARSSSTDSAKAASASGNAGKAPGTPQTLEEWLDESLSEMEELSRNETLRRGIARGFPDLTRSPMVYQPKLSPPVRALRCEPRGHRRAPEPFAHDGGDNERLAETFT